jgi:anti-sigma28 factor (negative regulator of flagellin synthesis)
MYLKVQTSPVENEKTKTVEWLVVKKIGDLDTFAGQKTRRSEVAEPSGSTLMESNADVSTRTPGMKASIDSKKPEILKFKKVTEVKKDIANGSLSGVLQVPKLPIENCIDNVRCYLGLTSTIAIAVETPWSSAYSSAEMSCLGEHQLMYHADRDVPYPLCQLLG